MRIDARAEKIIKLMNGAGEKAYCVGGCVRDFLLGKEPHDFDICTSAEPMRTKEILKDFPVIETGLKHGTVTVIADGEPIEVTTWRIDGSSDRSERNRRRVTDKRYDSRAERRTAETCEKRSGKRRGCSEARRGFKERNKKETYDYRLDPSVGADGLETVVYRRHRARHFQSVHNEDRAGYDYQNVDGIQKSRDRISGQGQKIHIPENKAEDAREQPRNGKRVLRGPVESRHNDDAENDRHKGDQSKIPHNNLKISQNLFYYSNKGLIFQVKHCIITDKISHFGEREKCFRQHRRS